MNKMFEVEGEFSAYRRGLSSSQYLLEVMEAVAKHIAEVQKYNTVINDKGSAL